MLTLRGLAPDELKAFLREMSIPMGSRVKITTALEQSTAIESATEYERQRCERLRKEIAELDDVISSRDLPPELECSIMTELMVDPVVAADGQTYERHAIEAWFAKHNTSPVTGAELANKELYPSQTVRSLVLRFLEKCRASITNP